VDTSFFSQLKITGYVPRNSRGTVSGLATGVPTKFEAVLHWHNNAAQYWTRASANGSYVSPAMKPGTYTMVLYRDEFPLATSSVTVDSGSNKVKDISSTETSRPVIWRIGDFDGQPFELKNGDKIERMHPSDVRMGSWGGSYTVGRSSAHDFPMALFAKQGGAATVTFNLAKEQVVDTVLRVGTTLSFKGGRPSVKIGSWTGRDPGAPVCVFPRVNRWESHLGA
jgi:rhamnogalacturonan endolyase